MFVRVTMPDYAISSWTKTGIVADTEDDLEGGVGHRLSINFETNSVVVTDYPKKLGGKEPRGRALQSIPER